MAARLKPLPSDPSPAEWRAAMGYFPSGVTIVTTWDGAEPVGSTVNAFCSVSLEPPLLLICIDRKNPIRRALERARIFGVNILPEDGGHIAHRFAREPVTDRFCEFGYRHEPGGSPQLDAAPVFIDCAIKSIHWGGDHLVAIGRGRRIIHASTATPLLYHKGAYPKLKHG
ncbi:MAG TPA: flavin reductase family protein [Caulobacteraceae bacterium]|nr:flavin reductase family protein [Caulobacteraceae bacterium]